MRNLTRWEVRNSGDPIGYPIKDGKYRDPVTAIASATIGSSLISSNAASSAADTQAQATRDASGIQQQMFQQVQNNLAPYIQAGGQGLNAMLWGLGLGGNQVGGVPSGIITQAPNQENIQNFMNPALDFALQKGQNAILSNASALGGVDSGNTRRALMDYTTSTALNQGWYPAVTNFMNYQRGLADLFGGITSLGENAAAGVGNAGIRTGEGIGSNLIQGGNAMAAGQVGSANAITSGIGGVANNYLLARMLQGQNTPAPTGYTNTPWDTSNWGDMSQMGYGY